MCASILRAQPDPAAVSGPGWARQGHSLLLYDANGDLQAEIGLEPSEEASSAAITTVEFFAGTSPAAPGARARFAWTLERRIAWNLSRTRKLQTRSLFRFLGSEGRELWTSKKTERPEHGEPIVFSADGETIVLALDGFKADVRTYIGNTLFEAGPFSRLHSLFITPNGKYAMVRWYVEDKGATHTFLDIAGKRRQDLDSEKFLVRAARLSDDGKVYSGDALLFDFAASSATR